MRIIWTQGRKDFAVANHVEHVTSVQAHDAETFKIYANMAGCGDTSYLLGVYSTEQRAKDVISILGTWFSSDKKYLEMFPDDETLDCFQLGE